MESSTLLLDQLEETDQIKHCHCPKYDNGICFCGAYKPKRCNVPLVDSNGVIIDFCPVCKKPTCHECIDALLREGIPK